MSGRSVLRMCLALLVLAGHPMVSADSDALIVRYPREEMPGDQRNAYPLQLLSLALAHENAKVTLTPSPDPMPQSRGLRQLAERKIDVLWTMTNHARERDFLPIRIPIHKGLIGWRLLLIRADQQSRFDPIDNADGLKALRAGQGHDWPDTKILQANEFLLTSATNYHSLFKMLHAGRIDYFPRSVVEIWKELEAQKHMGLAVESHLVIVYPTAFYFFVHKENVPLATTIENGLEAAIKNGQFEALFRQHHWPALQRAQLASRRIIRLPNPELPEKTPQHRRTLWFQPESTSARD